MILIGKDGVLYTVNFDCETLYDLVTGLYGSYGQAIVIIKATTLEGLHVTLHLREIDIDATMEVAITENHPPITDEEIKDFSILALHGLQ